MEVKKLDTCDRNNLAKVIVAFFVGSLWLH